jgi:hypothetical protein
MKTKSTLGLLIALLATILLPTWSIASYTPAQLSTQRYFPETGHTVSGEFLIKYESVKDPIRLFGYPITEAYPEPNTGLIIQYFQRARFEYHAEEAEGQRVKLTPLGDRLYQTNEGQVSSIPTGNTTCRVYPQTNHKVCYEFLRFFDNFGGIKMFGYPISELENQNDRIVQYFQYSRLEWRPEYPAGKRVILSDLGSLYFEKSDEDIARLEPPATMGTFIPEHVLNLQLRAFVIQEDGIKGHTDAKYRTLYVIVQDQNRRLIPGAVIEFNIFQSGSKVKEYSMPLPTNSEGFTFMSFNSDFLQPKQLLEIEVSADYDGIKGKTQTAFWNWD